MDPIYIVIIVLGVLFAIFLISMAVVTKKKQQKAFAPECSTCPYAKECKEGKVSKEDVCPAINKDKK